MFKVLPIEIFYLFLHDIKIIIMKIKQFLLSICLGLFVIPNVKAQTAEPTISFMSSEDETTISVAPGESQTCNAPLEITFNANLKDITGWSYKLEWRLYDERTGVDSPVVTRFEPTSTFTLTQSGGYAVILYVTFTDAQGHTIDYESQPMRVSISESKLSCPDGFSPNNDKINDVFVITHQSIVKIEGGIFNRWGQKLHTFTLNNLDEGWDGYYNGKVVKDGAYFLNIQAVGSDGMKYNIKKVINVLTGFRTYER